MRAYLNPPESTIVHVVRGDIDPDTDPGAKYLTPFLNIPNKMLTVLTHTDLWLADHDKIQFLQERQKTHEADWFGCNHVSLSE